MRDHPHGREAELARAVGINRQLAHYHVEKLRGLGLVRPGGRGTRPNVDGPTVCGPSPVGLADPLRDRGMPGLEVTGAGSAGLDRLASRSARRSGVKDEG